MADPALIPLGVTVDAVDWLPSGARSGLVRVRGRRPHGPDWALPALVLTPAEGAAQRLESLPDPRADRDPSGWRGAYVVEAAAAAGAVRWELEWGDGGRFAIPAPVRDEAGPSPVASAGAGEPGGEVVDRAVLAERRARRAEAAEQAQARIAKEALRAVEVLELRAGEVEAALERAQAERDALHDRLAAGAPAGADASGPGASAQALADAPPELAPDAVAALDAELRSLRAELARRDQERAEPPPAAEAERRAARLREALTATVGTVAELRLQLHEAQVARRTRELEWSAGAVRLSVLEREHGELQAALGAARAELEKARCTAAEAEAAVEAVHAEAAAAQTAHDDTRAALADREAELSAARERIGALQAELDDVRARTDRVAEEAAEAARIVAVAESLMREQEREEASAARLAEAEAATTLAEGRLAHLEASLDEVETARELAEARAAAAVAARQVAEVALAAARAPATDPLARPPTGRFARTAPVSMPVAVDRAAAPTSADEDKAPDPFAAAAERLRRTAAPADGAAMSDNGAPPGGAAIADNGASPDGAAVADNGASPDGAAVPADVARPPGAGARPAFDAPMPPAFAPSPGAAPAAPPPVPDDVIAAAAEQMRVAAERASTGDAAERERVVAGLAAAAEALRARVAAAAPAPAASDVPGPGLAAALVTLARQDAAAAAGLLTGLLPAAHLALDGDLDADVTLVPAGTFAVVTAAGASSSRPLDRPRPRREAAAHLRADAVAMARLLAGEDVHPRRFTGPLRLSGPGRRAVHLDRLRSVTAAEALQAGAVPDPAIALRLLALAVPAAWTRGHDFTLAVYADGSAARICVRDGDQPVWDPDPLPAGTRVLLRAGALGALLAPRAGGDAWTVEGDPAPAAVLRGWLDRLLGPRA